MAGGSIEDDDAITGINVTPLVDVMLVLLIIFMVTATYIVNRSIEINLPKAATGEDVPSENLAFTIDKESKLFLNGETITFADIPGRIEGARALESNAGKKMQALIAADQATPHGTVIKLIDEVRKNGITDFAINVEADK